MEDCNLVPIRPGDQCLMIHAEDPTLIGRQARVIARLPHHALYAELRPVFPDLIAAHADTLVVVSGPELPEMVIFDRWLMRVNTTQAGTRAEHTAS